MDSPFGTPLSVTRINGALALLDVMNADDDSIPYMPILPGPHTRDTRAANGTNESMSQPLQPREGSPHIRHILLGNSSANITAIDRPIQPLTARQERAEQIRAIGLQLRFPHAVTNAEFPNYTINYTMDTDALHSLSEEPCPLCLDTIPEMAASPGNREAVAITYPEGRTAIFDYQALIQWGASTARNATQRQLQFQGVIVDPLSNNALIDVSPLGAITIHWPNDLQQRPLLRPHRIDLAAFNHAMNVAGTKRSAEPEPSAEQPNKKARASEGDR